MAIALVNSVTGVVPGSASSSVIVLTGVAAGNKLIVRYGKVTEDLLTPIVGFIDPKEVPKLDKVGAAVWDNYRLPGDQRKPYVVKFTKGRDE